MSIGTSSIILGLSAQDRDFRSGYVSASGYDALLLVARGSQKISQGRIAARDASSATIGNLSHSRPGARQSRRRRGMCNACLDAGLSRRRVVLSAAGLLAAAPLAGMAQAQPVAAADNTRCGAEPADRRQCALCREPAARARLLRRTRQPHTRPGAVRRNPRLCRFPSRARTGVRPGSRRLVRGPCRRQLRHVRRVAKPGVWCCTCTAQS